ncbi:hypothetical protein QP426_01440 [Pauljensenia sp. UMB1235]|uniref:MFS transporter n=1 Tax=unclassified Pauljensenia TaxID=2908895 RepID=UPI00254FF246|nr:MULTISPECIES: MFS transporter [unclassified Pauljensenia]MDK6399775.1 hypothetical protein [Pauljensenia sp. UMB9872]MDK7172336.1 hypothetical protein [Pauljensenia sp. UMB1235]
MTSSEGGGLHAYAALLRRPHVAPFLLGGVIIQFPYAMVNMALLIGARDVYGSYSSAGVATAVMSSAGAVIGPTIGRLIDRHGQSRIASLVGAFWIASILGLGLVLVLGLPYWALLLVVVMLGVSVPGGSLIRARWRVALRSEPGSMPLALSLTSVAEESMWVLSTPIATSLATLVHPLAALAFGIGTILIGLRMLADRTFQPEPLRAASRSRPLPLDEAAPPSAEEADSAPHGDPGAVGAREGARRAKAPEETLWTGTFVVLLAVLVFYGAFQSTTGIAIVAFAQERGMQAWAGSVSACFSAGSMIGALVYGMRRWPGALWARGEAGVPYSLADACQDHLLGLAIEESARTGREVVTEIEAWATGV